MSAERSAEDADKDEQAAGRGAHCQRYDEPSLTHYLQHNINVMLCYVFSGTMIAFDIYFVSLDDDHFWLN